ncbi:MAG: radical SAM protein [Nitrospirae bacterium]|nr:radical SAM protein [Nitrospirota bacterium]
MRILLLNPPARKPYLRDYFCSTSAKAGYYWPAIDLLVQSGILSSEADVEVIDAVALRLDPGKTLSRIAALQPDAVLSLCSAPSMGEDLSFLEEIRRLLGCRLFAIGEPMLDHPERKLRDYPFMDGFLTNFVSRDVALWMKGRFDRLENGTFRIPSARAGRCGDIALRAQPLKNGFRYPLPRHEWFRRTAYRMPFVPSPFASVLTTYGCPHHCAYCNSGWIGFAFRDPDNVLEEVEAVVSQGYRHVFFKDMTFGAARRHTETILHALVDRRWPLTWHGYARADTLDESFLDLMKHSGCVLLQFGVESSDAGLLSRLGRDAPIEKVQATVRSCARLGIRVGAHFVLGLPGSTEATVAQTVGLACELNPDFASFNIAVPRAGTPLAADGGAGRPAADSSTGDGGFALPELPPALLRRLQTRAYRRYYFRPGYLRKVIRHPAAFPWGMALAGLRNWAGQ